MSEPLIIPQDSLAGLMTVLQGLQNKLSLNDELWTYQEIAAYLKLSPKTVLSHTIKQHAFPRPVSIPGSGDKGQRRWYAKEVRKWIERHR